MGHGLLADHPIFDTTDLEEAEFLTSQFTGAHRLIALDHEPRQAQFRAFPLADGVNLLYFSYGGRVRVDVPSLPGSYLMQTPLAGPAIVKCGKASVIQSQSMGAVITNARPMVMDFEPDTERLVVLITRNRLQRQLAALAGHVPQQALEFELACPVDREPGRSLHQLALHTATQVRGSSGAAASPIWREQLADLLCTTLLLSQPNNHSRMLRGEETRAAPYYVRRVESFIEAHADEAITMPRLVAAGGVSARALQAGFRRYRETTPMGFVRAVRLERARKELMKAGEGDTVAEVAMRLGLTHLGRFSTHYRKRFGESPSETLRRSLARA